MRITSLTLQAFRSYVNVAFNLDAARILISGVNGSGKTSVRDALAWALTGSTPEMSGKGAGGELLAPVTLKPAQARVTCVLDGLSIDRSWGPRDGAALRVGTWTGNSTEQQAALEQHLTVTPALLHVLCDARAFLRLDHADAKALLLALLDVKIAVQADPDKPAEAHTLEQLDAAYDMAVQDRKVTKQRLAKHLVPTEPVSPVVYKPVEQYEARLRDLRTELAALERGIGETLGAKQALYARLQALDGQRLGILNATTLRQMEETVETQQARLAAFVDDTTIPGSAERLVFLKGRVEALAGHRPDQGCVLDSSVPCKTPRQAFTALAGTYEGEIEAMPAPALPSKRGALEASLRDMVKRLEGQKQALAQNAQIDAEVATLEQQIAALPDTSDQEAAIAAKKAHIAKGESITADARRFAGARDAWAVAQREFEKLTKEVARLEGLCELLGPKGLRVEALSGALSTFLALVQPYLTPFGWTLRFSVDPWMVYVNDRPAQTYSQSERYRIGVGLQLAIAQASGLSFAVVDELDQLDADGNRKLGTLLYNSPVEQIIILRTRDTTVVLPMLPGVLAYRLGVTDGKSAIIETVSGVGAAA